MMVFDQMLQAVQAAAPDRLGEVASAIWQAYGAGGLTDAEAEQLDGLLNARRGAARAAPSKAQPLAAVAAQLVPAVALPPRGERAPPARAHYRTGSRPRTPDSMARRRRWAAAGYLPPALAAAFTQGEQAVLAVVALEVGKRGACTLALGHIAALAGVSETTAKRALRQARTLGLVTVEERRLSRSRNDTNVLRVASREWAAWLRLRLPRANRAGLCPPGGQVAPPTNIRVLSANSEACLKGGRGPVAHPHRAGWPATRAAGARGARFARMASGRLTLPIGGVQF
ncbi:hypothetical protein ACU4GR_29605 [Methylobacterium oryzae CBMB20]